MERCGFCAVGCLVGGSSASVGCDIGCRVVEDWCVGLEGL